MPAILVSAKVSVFQQNQINYHRRLSYRSYLAQTLIKHKKKTQPKHRLNNLFITKQEQKSKNKNDVGLPPNKRYRLTPLARHKSKDRSRYCHLW